MGWRIVYDGGIGAWRAGGVLDVAGEAPAVEAVESLMGVRAATARRRRGHRGRTWVSAISLLWA